MLQIWSPCRWRTVRRATTVTGAAPNITGWIRSAPATGSLIKTRRSSSACNDIIPVRDHGESYAETFSYDSPNCRQVVGNNVQTPLRALLSLATRRCWINFGVPLWTKCFVGVTRLSLCGRWITIYIRIKIVTRRPRDGHADSNGIFY